MAYLYHRAPYLIMGVINMLNATKNFIIDMKPEAEAYLYNMASSAAGFSPACASGIMSHYKTAAEKAIKEMTMIACQKFPEAFCQFVVMHSCELFLLDRSNDSMLISGTNLTAEGSAIMTVYNSVLKSIASDPKKPAGVHNEMRMDFVKKELFKRMK